MGFDLFHFFQEVELGDLPLLIINTHPCLLFVRSVCSMFEVRRPGVSRTSQKHTAFTEAGGFSRYPWAWTNQGCLFLL